MNDLEKAKEIVYRYGKHPTWLEETCFDFFAQIFTEIRRETAEECANIASEHCFYEIEGIIRKRFLK